MAQSLLNQIAAYEQNYILVETLLEESKARAQALETIDKMKEDMQEVYASILHNYIIHSLSPMLPLNA